MDDNEGIGCFGMMLKLMFRPITMLFLIIVIGLIFLASMASDIGEYWRAQAANAEPIVTPMPTDVKARGCIPGALWLVGGVIVGVLCRWTT